MRYLTFHLLPILCEKIFTLKLFFKKIRIIINFICKHFFFNSDRNNELFSIKFC